MTADTHEELMEFASKLGLRASWLQHAGRPAEHFDLTPGKRAQALRLGAKEFSLEEGAEQLLRKSRGST